jgi:hypothetical protein
MLRALTGGRLDQSWIGRIQKSSAYCRHNTLVGQFIKLIYIYVLREPLNRGSA